MQPSLLTIILIILSWAAQAQIKIEGRIIDNETRAPIVGAHIYNLNAGTYSNFNGQFDLLLNSGDTLLISHVAYENQILIYTESQTNLRILMTREDQLLDPFIVHHLPALEQFKREIINAKVFDRNVENANINMARIKQQYLYGFIPEMNAMDNYKEYIKGPKGITLFSTQSNKGLVGALKNGTYYSLERDESPFGNDDFGRYFPFTKSRLDSTRRLIADSI